jgi:hypothetical protein
MQIVQEGLAASDFPPRESADTLRPMTDVLTAGLTLRFRDGRLQGRVHWPRAMTSDEAPPLILLLEDDEDHGAALCALAGAVVLAAGPAGASERAVLAWAAEHAAELGAGRLIVAGRHAAAARALGLALAARDDGWPPLYRQLLLHPRLSPMLPATLEGVAPAVVLGGCKEGDDAARYVARLRWSGVVVDDLRRAGDLARALRWTPCECGS